jgi:hypothetical protein
MTSVAQFHDYYYLLLCSNASNVIVRVNGEIEDAIMISAHYDSCMFDGDDALSSGQPGSSPSWWLFSNLFVLMFLFIMLNLPLRILADASYGSSDDGTPIVVMLEALRAILNDEKPYYSLIFLFDAGEEQGLFGAHLFATQHPWYTHVKTSINLEAMGAGGQDMVFRTNRKFFTLRFESVDYIVSYFNLAGSGVMLKLYSKVPRPRASILGEDVFRSGMIGSDTDFTIYKLPGLDLATVRKGQVYHTKFDNIENVPEGTLQFRGNNFLSMARECSKVKDIHAEGRSLFFDVF